MLVTDLDGTLLNDSGNISSKTIEEIIKIHNRKILFSIASGRPLTMQEFQNWNLGFEPELRIGLNGGECFDYLENKTYHYYQLSKETINEIVKMMNEINLHHNFFVHGNGNIITNKYDSTFEHQSYSSVKRIIVTNNDEKVCCKENCVILFRFESKELADKAMKIVKQYQNDKYKVFKSSDKLVEFVDTRLSKTLALKEFCKRHNLLLEEVIACGDSDNDMELLKDVGLGICMVNGSVNTKNCAQVISKADNNHDGMIDEVLKFL